uniref:Uncharacterized protein n=1 Tax=Anopheles atroparvus TaxID=41427 RepID=A0A182J3S0_ANOAO
FFFYFQECQNLIEENRRLVSIATAASGGGGSYGMGGGMLHGVGGGSGSLSTLGMGVPNGGSYTSVESVILQTQVETLQWQLKQVDSSRHMYRAVMEEVVRFLDRCYRSLDALQSGQIGRSKSVLQVSKTSNGVQHNHNLNHHHTNNNHHHHDSDSSISGPRTDSGQHEQSMHSSTPSPKKLKTIFFTAPVTPLWRRSPKRTQTLPISSNEVDPEKLAQEAFRLLRTVQNLLNTQEPTLAQSTNALDSLISASTAASSCGSSTTLTGVGLSGASGAVLGSSPTLTGTGGGSGGGSTATGANGGVALVNTRSNVGFSRKLNMRGSRLSVRSSTADSVHSTSSSTKTETDEDNTDRPSPPLLLSHHHHHLLHHQSNGGVGGVGGGGGSGGTVGVGGSGGGGGGSSSSSCSSSTSGNGSITGNGHHHHHSHHHNPAHRYSANIERIKEMMISSSAEDESGFSSMNSFQEIGLPLVNSTMLSSVGSSHGVSNGSLGEGSSSSTDGSGSSSKGGANGAGANSFGVSDDSSELRENTVIPTALNGNGGHSSGNGSANKLGIPASPAKMVSSSNGGSTSTGAAATTTSTTTSIGGSPLRVTQTASYEHHTHFVNHRRWDSAPVVPPKLKIHASETDTVSRVLWV